MAESALMFLSPEELGRPGWSEEDSSDENIKSILEDDSFWER